MTTSMKEKCETCKWLEAQESEEARKELIKHRLIFRCLEK